MNLFQITYIIKSTGICCGKQTGGKKGGSKGKKGGKKGAEKAKKGGKKGGKEAKKGDKKGAEKAKNLI